MGERNLLRFDMEQRLPSVIQARLNTLRRARTIFKLVVLSEVAVDSLWLNGVAFSSRDWIFPMAAGWDLGCGYRVCLVSKPTLPDKELVHHFIKAIGSQAPRWRNELHLRILLSNPKLWIDSMGLPSSTLPPEGISEDRIDSLEIPPSILVSGLCQLAPGNHFIELREKVGGKQELQRLAILHSGVGKPLEYEYMRLVARLASHVGQSLTKGDAYSFRVRLEDKRAHPLLATIQAYRIIAWANRSILGSMLAETHPAPVQTLLDEAHDEIIVEGDIALHKKGAQEYTRDGYAIIPGNLDEEAYIVRSTGESRFINHSPGETPEGIEGRHASLSKVYTNMVTAPQRQFRSVQTILSSAQAHNLFSTCSCWSPLICIKAAVE